MARQHYHTRAELDKVVADTFVAHNIVVAVAVGAFHTVGNTVVVEFGMHLGCRLDHRTHLGCTVADNSGLRIDCESHHLKEVGTERNESEYTAGVSQYKSHSH